MEKGTAASVRQQFDGAVVAKSTPSLSNSILNVFAFTGGHPAQGGFIQFHRDVACANSASNDFGMQEIGEQFPPGTPPHWLVYFAVDDVDRTAAVAAEAGATVLKAPFDTSVGKMAVISDPQGAVFMVMAPEPPGAD